MLALELNIDSAAKKKKATSLVATELGTQLLQNCHVSLIIRKKSTSTCCANHVISILHILSHLFLASALRETGFPSEGCLFARNMYCWWGGWKSPTSCYLPILRAPWRCFSPFLFWLVGSSVPGLRFSQINSLTQTYHFYLYFLLNVWQISFCLF
jgi:hypothetical protein